MIITDDLKEWLRANRPPGTDEFFAALYAADAGEYDNAVKFGLIAFGKGNLAVAWPLLGGLLRIGETGLAAKLSKALVRDPNFAWVRVFIGAESIRVGDFSEGARHWADNEERNRLVTDIPPWRGEPISGKTVLIASGSPLLTRNSALGYGDEILLARFAPELAKRGAIVYLRAHPLLYRLFQSLPGVNVLNGTCDTPTRPDYCANPEQLPHLLESLRETLPHSPYLRAGTLHLEEGGLKIGLSWGSGIAGPARRDCALSELFALSQVPGARLYSLEKSERSGQLHPAPAGMEIADLGAGFRDFYETAEAINAMDVIVSTDNVIANLAGALGKRVFVLCNEYPEYRWGDGEKTAWYPTAKVLRRAPGRSWRDLARMAAGDIGGRLEQAHKEKETLTGTAHGEGEKEEEEITSAVFRRWTDFRCPKLTTVLRDTATLRRGVGGKSSQTEHQNGSSELSSPDLPQPNRSPTIQPGILVSVSGSAGGLGSPPERARQSERQLDPLGK